MSKLSKDLRIIFMGTPLFASSILEELVERQYNVVGVVTVPDKPAGRGMQLRCSAVKEYVQSLNAKSICQIPLLQPEKLRSEEFIGQLKSLNADLFIVVAFRMLPEVVWAMPELGTFNLHASLLPQYRGAAPINWAIINGETKSGVTTFFLNEKIDCGSIILQRECAIGQNDTAGDLHDNLLNLARALVPETVEVIARGDFSSKPQSNIDEASLTPAPKIFKEDMQLHFDTTPEDVFNKVRGLSPFPSSWCQVDTVSMTDGTERKGFKAKVFNVSTEICEPDLQSGVWESDAKTYLRVSTNGGWVYLNELQPDNKKRMKIVDFLRGWR
ncbi:MAG: methionyl-tRNA formyltransferase [Rikenellaceae bacterium]